MTKKKETTAVKRASYRDNGNKTEAMWGPHTYTYSMPAYDHNATLHRSDVGIEGGGIYERKETVTVFGLPSKNPKP